MPNHSIAKLQHAAFIQVLRDFGTKVHVLKNLPDVSIQLYPRDIAFAIDDTLFLARSRDPIRQKEQRALESMLSSFSRVERLENGLIEGGDVIVSDSVVFVGLSEASNREGVTALRQAMKQAGIKREIIPIEFSGRGVVHLDTKFTLVGPGLAYVHSAALTPHSRAELAARFEIIEATDDDARSLRVNTVALAPNRIIIDRKAQALEQALHSHGVETVVIDFSEVTKFPGGFRCATLPLRRGKASETDAPP
ncbi:arginine deiminase family protein [Lysinibacter sp. HNR]|uniref:dimethylarginine dimethylaminohydrolase family protein n=1 Tax=Lysinibacter sp. HNR TaxID=3031408 RepID=UPI00243605B6|nr:arginine deiminase family protein [Lysinibacter sp. HNR]WGD36524.1 arginine deiminase family protein [Lysinibacter sp. HNR]